MALAAISSQAASYIGSRPDARASVVADDVAAAMWGQNDSAKNAEDEKIAPASTPSAPTPSTPTTNGAVLTPAAGVAAQRLADFDVWRSRLARRGWDAASVQKQADNAAAFAAVINKAAAANGFADAKSFLKRLSPSELTALQTVHHLGATIKVDALSEEGAENLLAAPDQARDLDGDGFTMVGEARGWVFPPADAPAAVKQAWNDMCDQLRPDQIMTLTASFLPVMMNGASIQTLSTGESYSDLTRRTLINCDLSRQYDGPEQTEAREQQMALLHRWLGLLEQRGL